VPYLIACVHMYNKLRSVLWTFAVAFTKLIRLQADWVLCRFDLLGIYDASLFSDLIHGFHDDNRLLPGHSLALEFPVPQTSEFLLSVFYHDHQNLLSEGIYLAHSSASQNMPCPGIGKSCSCTLGLSPFLILCGSTSSSAGINL